MRRVSFVGTLLGAVLLTFGLLGMSSVRTARTQQVADLRRDVERSVSEFDAYFERARSLVLLLSQDPAFSDFYRLHDGDRRVLRTDERAMAKLVRPLRYLETLYPGRIGEACFIDAPGAEFARVVDGKAAPYGDLSLDETGNPFFGPTLAMGVGEVYQAAPYVSPDVHTWVISNSTHIVQSARHNGIVHFEVTLSSFLQYLPRNASVSSAVLDYGADRQVLGTADTRSLAGWSPLPQRYAAAIAADTDQGTFTVEGHPAVFQRLGARPGNANEWVVVEAATFTAGPLPMWLAFGAASAGGALLLASILVLRRQQRALRAAARLDHLTGLSNRLAVEEALQHAIPAGASGAPCGLLVIDLDSFKQINDTLGHQRGDEVLQEIARRLHANTFEYDVVARLGGDEFAVVARELAEPDDILSVAQRLHQALTRPIEVAGQQRFVGASIGAAASPTHGSTPDELLRNADAAMYAAKREHAPPRLYEPGTVEGADDLTMAAELVTAIERQEIVLHYQPQIDLETGHVVAVEGLARWQHPQRGLLPPSGFIPLAERTGLIKPLTITTLRQALSQARDWQARGTPVRVGVNLSSQLLSDPTLADQVLDLLEEHSVPADLLELEVTETALIADPSRAAALLGTLRDAGVHIDLDDFGTGYTSLHSLRGLPLETVKLDRELLTSMLALPSGVDMLAGLVRLIAGLGLRVLAEGVETEAQAAAIREAGCVAAQGFYFGRPVAAEQLSLPDLERSSR